MTYPLFGVQSARHLFELTTKVLEDFNHDPSVKDCLFLIFSYNHLREWIAGKGWEEIQHIKKADRSPEEQFFCEIFEIPQYKIIQNLCNRSKHFSVHSSDNSYDTNTVDGFRCDFSRCGDRLGQSYFTVDDKDIRDCFLPLQGKYHAWFQKVE